jgi:hypothetical protein
MLLLLLGVLAAVPSERDARLAAAIARYETAQFTKAREALLVLVEDGSGLKPSDHADARCYLAASYLALGDRPSAKSQLRWLAREQPDARPSAAAFPPDVIALASEARVEIEKQQSQERPPVLVPAPTPPPNVELGTPAGEGPPSRVFAFVPLGVGHFVRGAAVQGVAWLGLEVLTFVTSAAALAKLESLKVDEPSRALGTNGTILPENMPFARQLNVIYPVMFVIGVAAVIADIVIGNILWPTEAT